MTCDLPGSVLDVSASGYTGAGTIAVSDADANGNAHVHATSVGARVDICSLPPMPTLLYPPSHKLATADALKKEISTSFGFSSCAAEESASSENSLGE